MNLYEVLGVPKTATPAEIKKAYRRMARKYHPDRNDGADGAAHMMVLVNKAHDTLMDPAKREHYDLTGEDKPLTPIDVEAKNSILQLFAQLFQESLQTRFNIVARAKKIMREARAKVQHDRATEETFTLNLQKRRDEVTVAEGEENLWTQLIDSSLDTQKGKMQAFDHKLAVMKRAEEMMQAYRSGVIDAPPTMSGGAFDALRRLRTTGF